MTAIELNTPKRLISPASGTKATGEKGAVETDLLGPSGPRCLILALQLLQEAGETGVFGRQARSKSEYAILSAFKWL